VQSRRDRNESTAGITFEKLADSLRSQAEKLKSKHTSKRVDYEVVVKEGKTLIKPIVR
jgi:aspartate ammonia-lyase